MAFKGGGGGSQPFGNRCKLVFRGQGALLSFGNIMQSFAMLGFKLDQSFVVEMDAALVTIDLRFEFETAVLRLADLLFEFREPFAELNDFVLHAYDRLTREFDVDPQFVDRRMPF